MSAYTSESLWLSLYEAGWLEMTLNYGEFPDKKFQMSLTTSDLEEILPGLVAKYGENMPMTLTGKALAYPKSLFTPGQMGFSVSIGLDF